MVGVMLKNGHELYARAAICAALFDMAFCAVRFLVITRWQSPAKSGIISPPGGD